LISFLEVDPDLGRGLDPDDLPRARRLTLGLRHAVASGRWDVSCAVASDGASPFAALVIDGLMTRECLLGDAVNVEILGPGDVVDAWFSARSMMPSEVVWTALTPLTLALLDRRFLTADACHDQRALEGRAADPGDALAAGHAPREGQT
jgi:hypothetical protein